MADRMRRRGERMMACTLLVASWGCAHGYAIKLSTQPLDGVDPAVVGELSEAATSRGLLASMVAHRNTDSPDLKLTSSFSKEISTRPHDAIVVDIVYSDEQSSKQDITVIENFASGMEPPVKQQIDAIADDCYALLVKAVGPDKVAIERGPARRPW